MELTALADIKPFKSEWRIQVKVLHTWKHYTKLSGETLEIIMSDAHGTKILASCKKTYFEKFAKKVLVGTWRNIENFSINGPSVSYRPTNHQYKINFIYGTDITPSTLQNDNMFLSLVDFQTIQQGVEDENILIDVIGEVTDLGPLDTVLCYGKKRKKIEFSLTDLQGRRIACCLWGKFAESIQANCKAVGGDIVICLLCFVKVGTYRGNPLLSLIIYHIIVPLRLELTKSFVYLCQMRDVASNALTLVESEQDKLEREIRRDKWMQYPIRDIAELLSSTQLQDIESFPEAITDLVGKTFMFGIYIESNNVASKGGMYKVGKVWKDLSMLLTGGSTTESWTQSDVGTTNLSGSQGSLLVIESQANEDTVVTPSSKRKQQSNEDKIRSVVIERGREKLYFRAGLFSFFFLIKRADLSKKIFFLYNNEQTLKFEGAL
ncbi:hypothetical protein Bca52824_089712 [Brassica carinata]|uniref:Replication protein A 70 kDa DNA-binding subunit B/D first OB fold domain-containing protein n=1 Tax=Brassica carinata TaxID=52824 RepID=A0A8X7PCX2_BRACI|nr:hypothetical protein Bca52824_089712 [Brassica carinata]